MDAITYAMSKKYTDSKVTESGGLHREIVNSLPSTGDNNIIYMVLDPNASSPDVYDEWLWVNGAYEHIGSTRVDLSDYYNKTQIDAALSGKANTATTLSGYGITDAYTKTETDTALSSKANTSDIPTALSGLSDDSTHRLVTDAEKGTWNGKANTATSLSGYGITDAYTKTEVDTALSGKISSSEKGVSNGVAELDANGKIPSSQLPSYVDDTIEGYLYEGKWYSDSSHTHEVAGETEKIYVELSTNKTYRWSGSVFVEISESLALGETSSTAYRGDRGKEAYDHSQSDHSGVTPTFTEASTRANIATGESIATIFGKIKKFFSDLKAVAFSGSYADLSNTPDLTLKADKSLLEDGNDHFQFGVDANGNYGYHKTVGGADTVIPFKTVGTRSGAITANGTYTASTDISKNGYESVTVNVPNSVQTKTVTADTSNVTVTPDSGYIGMSSVTVQPTPSIEASVEPSTNAQIITPESGKLFSQITVGAISTQTKSVTPSTSAQTVSPDSGKYLSSVSVGAISTQTKTVTSSRSAQTVTPDNGKFLSQVTVKKYPDASGTYTPRSNSTRNDMGATNDYRYVNTTFVVDPYVNSHFPIIKNQIMPICVNSGEQLTFSSVSFSIYNGSTSTVTVYAEWYNGLPPAAGGSGSSMGTAYSTNLSPRNTMQVSGLSIPSGAMYLVIGTTGTGTGVFIKQIELE